MNRTQIDIQILEYKNRTTNSEHETRTERQNRLKGTEALGHTKRTGTEYRTD